jgi:hypothetical protein
MQRFLPGDIVRPGNEIGVVRHPEHHDGSKVYIATSPAKAWQYANLVWQAEGRPEGMRGLIYMVTPLGEVVERSEYRGEYMTTSARVVDGPFSLEDLLTPAPSEEPN